jgi:hypothetical protein
MSDIQIVIYLFTFMWFVIMMFSYKFVTPLESYPYIDKVLLGYVTFIFIIHAIASILCLIGVIK